MNHNMNRNVYIQNVQNNYYVVKNPKTPSILSQVRNAMPTMDTLYDGSMQILHNRSLEIGAALSLGMLWLCKKAVESDENAFYGLIVVNILGLAAIGYLITSAVQSNGREGIFFEKTFYRGDLERGMCDGWNYGVVKGAPLYAIIAGVANKAIKPAIVETILCMAVVSTVITIASFCKELYDESMKFRR